LILGLLTILLGIGFIAVIVGLKVVVLGRFFLLFPHIMYIDEILVRMSSKLTDFSPVNPFLVISNVS
jgi:hypothetical protein